MSQDTVRYIAVGMLIASPFAAFFSGLACFMFLVVGLILLAATEG